MPPQSPAETVAAPIGAAGFGLIPLNTRIYGRAAVATANFRVRGLTRSSILLPREQTSMSKGRSVTPAERWAAFQPPPLAQQPSIDAAIAKLNAMTPKEVFESSVRAGIHNPDGTLDAHYHDPVKP